MKNFLRINSLSDNHFQLHYSWVWHINWADTWTHYWWQLTNYLNNWKFEDCDKQDHNTRTIFISIFTAVMQHEGITKYLVTNNLYLYNPGRCPSCNMWILHFNIFIGIFEILYFDPFLSWILISKELKHVTCLHKKSLMWFHSQCPLPRPSIKYYFLTNKLQQDDVWEVEQIFHLLSVETSVVWSLLYCGLNVLLSSQRQGYNLCSQPVTAPDTESFLYTYTDDCEWCSPKGFIIQS